MRARVPASAANLGPGFDTLAVALSLHLEVELTLGGPLTVVTEGEGAGLFDDARHLGVRVAREVLGHDEFTLSVRSAIPLARGLGSSAALAVAAAAAAGAPDALAVAARVDGHGENAAASALGGLVAAGVVEGRVEARTLTLDPAWRFVCVVPEVEIATRDARRALPASVPFADAVFELNALALLLAGLADHRRFVVGSMDDRLHQPYRAGLVPFAGDLLVTLREAGAAGACWSGAGSTMLGLAIEGAAPAVRDAARSFLSARDLAGEVVILEADRRGLVVS